MNFFLRDRCVSTWCPLAWETVHENFFISFPVGKEKKDQPHHFILVIHASFKVDIAGRVERVVPVPVGIVVDRSRIPPKPVEQRKQLHRKKIRKRMVDVVQNKRQVKGTDVLWALSCC